MHRLIFTLLFLSFGFFLSAQSTARSVDLAVFPNPTSEFISVSDANNIVHFVEVYSLLGKKVKSFDFLAEEKYNVGDLPKGMYLVRILDEQKSILSTKKINKR